jgi:hypothetical protein
MPSTTSRSAPGIGRTDVAVAECSGERRQGVEQSTDVGVGRRPAGEPLHGRLDGLGRSAKSAEVTMPTSSTMPDEAAARSSSRAVAADSSVVP